MIGLVLQVTHSDSSVYVEANFDEGVQGFFLTPNNYQIKKGDLIQPHSTGVYWTTREAQRHRSGRPRRRRQRIDGVSIETVGSACG